MKRISALAFSFAALIAPAHAQEDEFEVVETHSQMEIVLIDADFLRPEDPTTSVFGGTTQLLDSETILIELVLNEPISSEHLNALKASDPDGTTQFLCDQVTLYLANGNYVALGEGCAPTES